MSHLVSCDLSNKSASMMVKLITNHKLHLTCARGAVFARHWSTEFMKHVLPWFTSPAVCKGEEVCKAGLSGSG